MSILFFSNDQTIKYKKLVFGFAQNCQYIMNNISTKK